VKALDFGAWYRECFAKNCPRVQDLREVKERKEVRENAVDLA
jgi:hypothetical protein